MEDQWLFRIRQNLSSSLNSGADWEKLTNDFDRDRIKLLLSKISKTIIKKNGVVILDRITKEYFSIVVEEIKKSEHEKAKKQYQYEYFMADCSIDDETELNDYTDNLLKFFLSQREDFDNWIDGVAQTLSANLPDSYDKEQQPEPQQEKQPNPQETKNRKLGRKTISFKQCILVENVDGFEKKIIDLMKDKDWEGAKTILKNLINSEKISRPSHKAFRDAFPHIEVPKSTYNTYFKGIS